MRAAAAAAGVKAIVLAMGIDGTLEGEGNDRMDIRLPGAQALLLETVLNATAHGVDGRNVRVVLLLFNGGMVTIEELKNAPRLAIVECWYPPA